MLNQDESNSDLVQQNWLWSDCKLVLRRTNPNNPSQESYENLQAEVQLQSDEIQEPFIPHFGFSKQFNFNQRKGFQWKKGTPLPPLVVKLQKSYLELLHQDQQIILIYCQLTVAYLKRKDTHFYLQEIRTTGQKRKQFTTDGTVQFDGIILKQSSHQKSNSKFSFLVTICASSIEQNKIILKTLISTAFHAQTPRIIRTKLKKSYKVTKLLPPNMFLKPICQLNSNEQKYQKKKLIQSLKYLTQNQNKLRFQHPFYLIYHFSHLLRIFYDAQQINSLDEVLELISPQINQSNYQNAKNTFLTYQLKKTKGIKKNKDKISINKQKKIKEIIQGKIQEGQDLTKKLLLLLTFENQMLRYIKDEILIEKEEIISNIFQKQLENEVQNLKRIFHRSAYFYIKVDLLRDEPVQNNWKNIQKQHLFEAYKKHYHQVYIKLKNQQSNQLQTQKEAYKAQ